MDSAGAGTSAARRQAGGVSELSSRGRDLGVVVPLRVKGEWKWTNINLVDSSVCCRQGHVPHQPHLFPEASEEIDAVHVFERGFRMALPRPWLFTVWREDISQPRGGHQRAPLSTGPFHPCHPSGALSKVLCSGG